MLEALYRRLAYPSACLGTVEVVGPVLKDWVNRDRERLTFQLTQVFTEYGCFGRYLHRAAWREPMIECYQCGCDEDTAEYTLVLCMA